MRRRAAKVDENQPELVKKLRAVGASVQPLSVVGQGVPDLLVGHRGVNWLLEVKDGSKVPSARRLSPDEKDWHRRWRGQVAVVEDFAQVLRVLGINVEGQ